MRRSPITVALLTLVLFAFTAGASAFAMLNKTVRIVVDGRHLSVHTFADTVADALRKAGVSTGPADLVRPAVDTPVSDGATVVVRHARPLRLVVDNRARELTSTSLTVREVLDAAAVATPPGTWTSAPRSAAVPLEGMTLQVRHPQRVTVLVDGHRRSSRTTAPTVRRLLRDLHVRLGRFDRVRTSLDRYPRSGLVVRVDRISRHTETRSVAIPFRTRYVHTASLYRGQSRVRQAGQPGVRMVTYRVTRKNHRVVHRTVLHSVLRSHPRARVVAVGTAARPAYSVSADGLNWGALAACESGGNPGAVSADGQYRGLYQFTYGTWAGVGGSGDPAAASASEQTYRAQLLYARSGASAWPVCGHYLYT